jgi:hypothetical protein
MNSDNINIDGFRRVVFTHGNSKLLIYIADSLCINQMQLAMLESHFCNMLTFLISNVVNIEMSVETTAQPDVAITAQMYYGHSFYDFCAPAPTANVAIATALSSLMTLALRSDQFYGSINRYFPETEPYATRKELLNRQMKLVINEILKESKDLPGTDLSEDLFKDDQEDL